VNVIAREPQESLIVFQNNLGAYGGRAVTPDPRNQNFLTQIDSGQGASSFTLEFSRPLSSVTFVIPLLFAGENGVSFPAWRIAALGSRGEEIDVAEGDLAASFDDIPGQRHTLRASADSAGITRLRIESDFRLNGRPFAAFSSVLIEEMILELKRPEN